MTGDPLQVVHTDDDGELLLFRHDIFGYVVACKHCGYFWPLKDLAYIEQSGAWAELEDRWYAAKGEEPVE